MWWRWRRASVTDAGTAPGSRTDANPYAYAYADTDSASDRQFQHR